MSQSTPHVPARKAVKRPEKPYSDFPLYAHPCGKWAKRIRGRLHYFGNWARRVRGQLVRVEGDGWEQAHELYKSQAADLHAGRTPRVSLGGITLADLCNRFLTAKLRKCEAGELSRLSFADYKEATDLLVAEFRGDRFVEDLAGGDFETLRATMAARWGPVRLGNTIARVRCVFKYALDNAMIERPVRYGSEFQKPALSVLRRHQAERGGRMLEAEQIRKLIDSTKGAMRAAILLGINCGLGNTDVATLRHDHLDLAGGWLDYPRPKTGIPRRCQLWPETVAAIRAACSDGGLVFRNGRGSAFVRVTIKSRTDCLSPAFKRLLMRLEMHRPGLSFYSLRHTFRTAADVARDPVACDVIMGHADPTMGARYREKIDDTRLKAVTDVVRAWLWPDVAAGKVAG